MTGLGKVKSDPDNKLLVLAREDYKVKERLAGNINPTRVYCTVEEYPKLASNSALQHAWTEAIAQGFLSLAKEILPDY